MSDWITYYQENKQSSLKRIKNMTLSTRYSKELGCWVNKYLDPFSVAKSISIARNETQDPFSKIRMEAEKDLEFTLLTATSKDRNNTDIILFESNLLLLFNIMLRHIRTA
ncbi:hypothetical protein [Methanolobus sp. ZRKC5]|uniref:hypothetical protein n=1 Tax=unclassified Methanolobus TaxID=2629569 RepID=UPI00313D14E1